MEDNIFGIKKKIPPDANCFYCIYWWQFFDGLGEDFRFIDKGYCHAKRQDTEKKTSACEKFHQRSGMFTPSQRESFKKHRSKPKKPLH